MVEGVYTLPVIRTLATGGAAGEELADLLGKPLDHAEREKALAIVRSNGAVHGAVEVAARYVAEAERYADRLPESPATTALRDASAALLATVTER
jgi:heptaprenyl diphosphate synthase